MCCQPDILITISALHLTLREKDRERDKGGVLRGTRDTELRKRQSIALLEGSQASLSRLSGKSIMKSKRSKREREREKSFKIVTVILK